MPCKLRIMQVIGQGPGELSAREFIEQLDECGEEELVVDINSEGGEVFDGFAIAEALRQYPGKVITRAIGGAFSIASVIFAAGDERLMAENAVLMIHDAMSHVSGSADEIRKTAETLDRLTNSILGVYVRHSNLDAETIRGMMREERMLDAREAVEMGLATGVIEATPTKVRNLSEYRGRPSQFVAAFRVNCHESQEDQMPVQERISEIKEKCKGASDSFVLEHIAKGSEVAEAVADWSGIVNAKNEELEKQNEELTARVLAMEERLKKMESMLEEEHSEVAEGTGPEEMAEGEEEYKGQEGAEMEEDEEEEEAMVARARRVPVVGRRSSGLSAADEWESAVAEAMRNNSRLSRFEAVKAVNRKNPGLRQRMLAESATNRERRILPQVLKNGVVVVR